MTGAQRLGLMGALGDSAWFLRKYLGQLAALILPLVLPIELINLLAGTLPAETPLQAAGRLSAVGLNLLVYPVYSVAVVYFLAATLADQALPVTELWRLGLRNWLRYLLFSLLAGGILLAGFTLFVWPGIYFAARLAFAEFQLLLEQQQPLQAIGRSWQATGPYLWLLAGGFVVIGLLLFPTYLLLAAWLNDAPMSWLWGPLLSALLTLLSSWFTIFAYRVYQFAGEQAEAEAAAR